jgi:predicted AAA+ superfamily ATPase
MELINRKIKLAIEAVLSYFPVITITGPRQSGKTTLCQNLFPDLPYINLEDLDVREAMMQDTRKYLNEYPQGLIIDEAHHYPDLFSYIMVTVDAHPERRYVLTGSSNFALLEKITQSLAGRTALFNLLPFSIEELGEMASGLSADLLMLSGGYPALWTKKYPRETFFSNYYSTYIERDVRQLINVKDIRAFQTFIRLSAGRIGTEYNASSLANEVGVTSKTIDHWLNILAASYIIYLLPPYYENIGKRLVKSPKIYFHDTGLACFLLGIENETQLASHPLRGILFENLVVNDIIKTRYNAGKNILNLYFYRDRAQKEVDLLHIGARVTHSALIYDGDSETFSQENGAYNFRHFRLPD